jgi:SAM-dependent methyltransferase
MASYVFKGEWHTEQARLAAIEALGDPFTINVLERVGVGPGWRCAEVGAGAGSLVRWLCSRVGQTGEVVATDLDTRYLQDLHAGNLEVIEHDVTSDPAPGRPFDLVHTRAVVGHLGVHRFDAIERLAGWLRPGGWLVIEDAAWSMRFPITAAPAYDAVIAAVLEVMASASGYDPEIGQRLPALFLTAGFVNVNAEGRQRMVRGSTPELSTFRLTIERLGPHVVSAGRATPEQVAAALAACDDPEFATMPPVLFSVWGQRPD